MSQESTTLSQPSVSDILLAQMSSDKNLALVLCYYEVFVSVLRDKGLEAHQRTPQAREDPKVFKIQVKKGFFSLASDFDFLDKTAFLEVPFKVYDCMAGHFISIQPSAFWRYPSPINPFYLVKDGRIPDSACPGLSHYINILSDATEAHLDTLPHIRLSSPLFPSSPQGPPPSPAIEYAEKGIQATRDRIVHLRKRKAPNSEVSMPAVKTCKTAKFEVNLHIHCGKDGHSLKNGMGSSIKDPIII